MNNVFPCHCEDSLYYIQSEEHNEIHKLIHAIKTAYEIFDTTCNNPTTDQIDPCHQVLVNIREGGILIYIFNPKEALYSIVLKDYQKSYKISHIYQCLRNHNKRIRKIISAIHNKTQLPNDIIDVINSFIDYDLLLFSSNEINTFIEDNNVLDELRQLQEKKEEEAAMKALSSFGGRVI